MIQRQLAAEILKDLRYFPVLAIIGPRQSGKTTIAKMLLTQTDKPSIYLDLESASDQYRLQDPEAFLIAHEHHCIVVDEVQLMPQLFPLLRSVIDRNRMPGRFILLGSAAPELIRGASESLSGRVAFHELSPLNLAEVRQVSIAMHTHWFRGGFPLAVLAPDTETSDRWLDQYFRSFVERDLRILLKQDIAPENMRRFMLMMSHLHGQMLNVSQFAGSLGISTVTANRYLDLLQGAFWINRLQPWYVNLGKRLVKSPKLYFRDSGSLHRLHGIAEPEKLQAHPLLGASWEGYVIEQIRMATLFQWQYHYYRTQTGAETDLYLISPEGKTWCIEIKAANTPVISKGFFQSVEDLKPDFKYVIVPGGGPGPIIRSDGLKICSLEHFLASELLF
ncbi:MAG: ATP-binding protein [Bacteroidota bacterium]